MFIIEYLIYVTHNFLILLKKVNDRDIKGRCINGVAIIIFLFCFLVFSIIYVLFIRITMLSFSETIYFVACISTFMLSFNAVNRRYRDIYESTVEILDNRLKYGKSKIIIIFVFIWFIPIFSFWGGVLLLKQ